MVGFVSISSRFAPLSCSAVGSSCELSLLPILALFAGAWLLLLPYTSNPHNHSIVKPVTSTNGKNSSTNVQNDSDDGLDNNAGGDSGIHDHVPFPSSFFETNEKDNETLQTPPVDSTFENSFGWCFPDYNDEAYSTENRNTSAPIGLDTWSTKQLIRELTKLGVPRRMFREK